MPLACEKSLTLRWIANAHHFPVSDRKALGRLFAQETRFLCFFAKELLFHTPFPCAIGGDNEQTAQNGQILHEMNILTLLREVGVEDERRRNIEAF